VSFTRLMRSFVVGIFWCPVPALAPRSVPSFPPKTPSGYHLSPFARLRFVGAARRARLVFVRVAGVSLLWRGDILLWEPSDLSDLPRRGRRLRRGGCPCRSPR